MTRGHERLLAVQKRAGVLAGALFAFACATTGTERPEQTAVRDELGFTITEEVRVSSSVRDDFERATHLLEQEDYEQGIALLVSVTESAPLVTSAHIDLAIAYGRVGDLARAEASLEKALDLNPRHPVAHNELGIVYRRTGRFEKARASYERALELYPDFHFARRNLAILCDVYLADASCAAANYEIYLQAVPDDQAAAMWVADLRNRTGQE
jgi:Tfp pilus assembly protein PilF